MTIFITSFGLLLAILSLVMIFNPKRWANGIIQFARKPYFHWFEVTTRLAVGVVFLQVHSAFRYPLLILIMGYLFIAVSIGLIIVGERKHRAFAFWSATRFKTVFRPTGMVSFVFAVTLTYVSLFPT